MPCSKPCAANSDGTNGDPLRATTGARSTYAPIARSGDASETRSTNRTHTTNSEASPSHGAGQERVSPSQRVSTSRRVGRTLKARDWGPRWPIGFAVGSANTTGFARRRRRATCSVSARIVRQQAGTAFMMSKAQTLNLACIAPKNSRVATACGAEAGALEGGLAAAASDRRS